MAENVQKMKPIWFFVGLILLVMGGLILAAGLVDWITGAEAKTVLAHLRPGIWWGGLMVVVGFLFVLTNKNASIE